MAEKAKTVIDGRLDNISYSYLNNQFESSNLTIITKEINSKKIKEPYCARFYGFVPESFMGKRIDFLQTTRDGRDLYQRISLKGNKQRKIEAIVENYHKTH